MSPPYIKSGDLNKGGIWLIEIIFQKDQDARKMYGHITGRLVAGQVGNGTLQIDIERKKIKIHSNEMPKEAFHTIKEGIYEFIVLKKRDDWFKGILTDRYLYTDPSEQDQILEIIYSIIEANAN